MPIDTRELRRGRNQLYELITTDRLCGKCRYNLKGLPSNGKCPECGTAISRAGRSRRFSDNLTDAPLFYLKTLAFGAFLLAVFSIVCAFTFAFLEDRKTMPTAMVAGATAVAWWVGVFIVTAPRQFGDNTLPDAVLDTPWLRVINRSMQALWIGSVMAWVLALRSGPPVSQIAYYTAGGLSIAALFGLVPLAVHLASLADWAGDSGLGDRFRVSAWALAACGVVSEIGQLSHGFTSVGSGLLYLGSGWATLGVSIAQIVFLVSLFQLAHMAVWAIVNSSTASDSNRRLIERREAEERDMAERTRMAGALNPPPAVPLGRKK